MYNIIQSILDSHKSESTQPYVSRLVRYTRIVIISWKFRPELQIACEATRCPWRSALRPHLISMTSSMTSIYLCEPSFKVSLLFKIWLYHPEITNRIPLLRSRYRAARNKIAWPDGEGDGERDGPVGGPEVVLQSLAEHGAHRRLLQHLLDHRQLRLHRLVGVLVELREFNHSRNLFRKILPRVM